MAYFRTCDRCGSNLDPGERCTCIEDEKREAQEAQTKKAVAFTMQLLNSGKKRRTKKRR